MMDLRSLKHVVTLARVLNFTKAAEELGMSQPALSRSIQSIEQRERVRLFDRDRGSVHLTAVGRLFAERASAILRETDDLTRVIRRAAHGAEGELAFGMTPLPAAALLCAARFGSVAQRRGLNVFVPVRSPAGLLPLLTGEKIEFFVSAETPFAQSAPLQSEVLGHFPISALVRRGHPLGARTPRRARERFPLLISGWMEEAQGLPWFRSLHLQSYSNRIVIEDAGILSQITETSDAVWVTSPFVALDAIAQGRLVELALPKKEVPYEPLRIVLYRLDRRSLSPAAQRTKEELSAEIEDLSRRARERRLGAAR